MVPQGILNLIKVITALHHLPAYPQDMLCMSCQHPGCHLLQNQSFLQSLSRSALFLCPVPRFPLHLVSAPTYLWIPSWDPSINPAWCQLTSLKGHLDCTFRGKGSVTIDLFVSPSSCTAPPDAVRPFCSSNPYSSSFSHITLPTHLLPCSHFPSFPLM